MFSWLAAATVGTAFVRLLVATMAPPKLKQARAVIVMFLTLFMLILLILNTVYYDYF